ncbi:MAG: hypothetical protein H6713_11570 [Myxococcales bacterium]|nr:hypothetical protein [Myxococcales bacterium]
MTVCGRGGTSSFSTGEGFGLGIVQRLLAARSPEFVRVLPDALQLELEVWLAMHEDLRATPSCRAVFDGLAEGLTTYAASARGDARGDAR